MGCMLGQHDETGKKEQAIYYLSKKFLQYEVNYSALEKTCCALAWTAHRLRHYMLYFTIHLISRMNPLKYIFEKPTLSSRIARWHMILSEFDIVFITQKSVKGSAIAEYLAENPVMDGLPTESYFPDEEVLCT